MTTEKALCPADWALTLHMLEKLAPGFFAAEQLAPVLERTLAALHHLPTDFPVALDEHEAMARVDAVYLRTLRGLPAKTLDLDSLRTWIDANGTRAPLEAWWVASVAGLPRPFTNRHPFTGSAHLYMLTHEVMLDTGFFSKPTTLHATLDELEAALPAVAADRQWDLAAEIAFTLRSAGRQCRLEVPLEPSESETGREAAHRLATTLIAFASGIRGL
ncbi:MAG: hypothetical protein QM723_11655 [Myxococcaceae bacterium]